MSPTDGPEVEPDRAASEHPDETLPTQMVETLVHVLIEKGVLTKNDALSIVRTVAQVQGGGARNSGANDHRARDILERMYRSFEALADGNGGLVAGGDNVHQLRPPIYGDRPEFPRDD